MAVQPAPVPYSVDCLQAFTHPNTDQVIIPGAETPAGRIRRRTEAETNMNLRKKMNRKLALLACLLFAAGNCVCSRAQSPAKTENPAAQSENSPFADQKAKVSYSIGMTIGGSLKNQAVEVDYSMLFKGIQDASTSGSKPLLTDQQVQEILSAFQQEQATKQQQEQKMQGEKNKTEGEAFLAANKAKAGVITLPSGLQYEILKEGAGNPPQGSDTVSIHYKGTLIGGKEFDSSYSRNEPASLTPGNVIPGMKEALMLMKPGSKWRVVIPASLAYGERQAGPISPNSTLIFELELLSVGAAPATPTPAIPPTPSGTPTGKPISR